MENNRNYALSRLTEPALIKFKQITSISSRSHRRPSSQKPPAKKAYLAPFVSEDDTSILGVSFPSSSTIEEGAVKLPTIHKKKTKRKSPRHITMAAIKKRGKKLRQHSMSQREEKLDVLLMNRTSDDFGIFIQEYLRRQQYPENSKVFILNGQFDYIRRCLKARGWVENKYPNSQAFHLKWSFNDSDNDYKTLRYGQFFNHISNNRELTTKSGLSKNLRNLCDHRAHVDTFFPRSYDLGDTQQLRQLKEDYEQTAITSLIKLHAQNFAKKPCKVDVRLLSLAMNYCRHILSNIHDDCQRTKKYPFMKEPSRYFYMSSTDMRDLLAYSEASTSLENWEYPSKSLMKKCIALSKALSESMPQYLMEGVQNIWIIKPGQNARGSGVRCVKGLKEILESGAQMQARVVQKYIENPLLLPCSIGMCKFDIRQWVLLSSVDPLTIYFYNSNYARVCQSAFTLSNLDVSVHLANYSVQKSLAKNQEDTLWELCKLKDYLKQMGCDWDLDILPKLHLLVIKTIKAASDQFEQRFGGFELLGFDIILDNNFSPWLLEVNLSPACAERTPWISEMLDQMAYGMFDILFAENQASALYDEDYRCSQNDIRGDSQEWVLLFKGENIPCPHLHHEQIEVTGTKFNVKKERVNEKKFFSEIAAVAIQRKVRESRDIFKKERIKKERIATLIQRGVRKLNAYYDLINFKRITSIIVIETAWRKAVATLEIKRLKLNKAVEYVQAHIKGKKGRYRFRAKKKIRACVIVQTCFRFLDSKLAHRYEIKLFVSIRRIQLFYRKRHIDRNHKALFIQRVWKGHLGRKCSSEERLYINRLLCIKKTFRKFLSHQTVKKMRCANSIKIIARTIKSFYRCKCLLYFKKVKAIIAIQTSFRAHSAKMVNKYLAMRLKAIVHVQAHLKGLQERNHYRKKKMDRSATVIKCKFKSYLKKEFVRIIKLVHHSAVVIQKNFKMFSARKKYQRFLMDKLEAKERKKALRNHRKEQKRKIKEATKRLYNRIL